MGVWLFPFQALGPPNNAKEVLEYLQKRILPFMYSLYSRGCKEDFIRSNTAERLSALSNRYLRNEQLFVRVWILFRRAVHTMNIAVNSVSDDKNVIQRAQRAQAEFAPFAKAILQDLFKKEPQLSYAVYSKKGSLVWRRIRVLARACSLPKGPT
jgi:hypothetical protein